jgi:hypothetical protein
MDLPISDLELLEIVESLSEGELKTRLELVAKIKGEALNYKKILREQYNMVI